MIFRNWGMAPWRSSLVSTCWYDRAEGGAVVVVEGRFMRGKYVKNMRLRLRSSSSPQVPLAGGSSLG